MRGVKDAMMQFSVSLFHTANFTRFLQPVKFQRLSNQNLTLRFSVNPNNKAWRYVFGRRETPKRIILHPCKIMQVFLL